MPIARSMATSTALTALLVALPLAAPAQQGPAQERAAAAYGAADWPASAAPRGGLDPATIKAVGWIRARVERDARHAAASVWFAPEDDGERARPLALVTVRRWGSATAARAALLSELTAIQVRLERLPGCGDLAFARTSNGLARVHGTCGDVAFSIRGLKPTVDLTALAAGVEQALRASRPREPGTPLTAPRVVRVDVDPAQPPGAPTRFRVDFDPAGPAPAALAFACTAGASVLKVAGGYELYPARPGPVTVELFVSDAGLATAQRTFEVQVPAR